ncbi:MAG: anaerobic ribonucleoside-triphosphate reductase activating protein [Lachnospiraceae bacterium]|nr:anaerobic ribonucleoside-triphosphate reductase activating protein [Lachnospiraceae bacterium]
MKIYGFQKTTLLDYPEHVAATVFTGGCNFRCPYCQNGGLVLCPGQYGEVPEEEVWRHLEKRKGILDGVCITGGEATLQPELETFIRRVKEMGYAVKLDTNGYRPEVVRGLLDAGLLDYVAMDVKASKGNYPRAVGLMGRAAGRKAEIFADEREDRDRREDRDGREDRDRKEDRESAAGGFDIGRIEESVELLKNSGISYEFRTTAVKGIHTVEEFERIGEWLAGCRAYFIQNYRADGEILQGEGLAGFSSEELKEMAQLAGKHVTRVELRGVE